MKSLAPGGTLIVVEWDKSMAEVWHFEEDALMSPEEIVALLPGLEIEKAEVRQVIDPFEQGSPGEHESSNSMVNVALVRARKTLRIDDGRKRLVTNH